MPACAIYGCSNYSTKTKGTDIKYFGFPKTDVAKAWIHACRRDKFNLKHASVCSEHFTKESFDIPLRQRLLNYNPVNSRNLKLTAIPTEKLPKSTVQTKRPLSTECDDRLMRLRKRQRHNYVADIITSSHGSSTEEHKQLEDNDRNYILSQELDMKDDQIEIAILKKTIEDLRVETQTLKQNYDEANQKIKSLQERISFMERNCSNEIQESTRKLLNKCFTPGQITLLLDETKKKNSL